MKLLLNLDKTKIEKYIKYTKSFIVGINNLSVNYNEYNIQEIKEIINTYPDIELFIALNKNMFNSDIDLLEQTMNELNNLNIKGILYYDLAVLYLKQKNKYKFDLVYSQDYQVTNYNTINYHYNEGSKYAYLASEITIDEIQEIKNNTKANLMALIFGYPIMSISKRKFITNYCNYNKKNIDIKEIIVNDKDGKYLVKESKNYTSITNLILLNSIESIDKLKNILDYGIIRLDYIENEELILDTLTKFIDNKITKEECSKIIYEKNNENDNFFNKKTIYKVK